MNTARILCLGTLATLALCPSPLSAAPAGSRLRTWANPIDLPYRYQPRPAYNANNYVPYREAADPTIVRFNGRYWMFVSHSKGYWHSADLLHWTFVAPTGLDVDTFAPTVVAMNGKLYFAASENVKTIWVTDDPMKAGAPPPYPGFAITQFRLGAVKAQAARCSGSLEPAYRLM